MPSPPTAPRFGAALLRRACLDAFLKLDPRAQIRNPVMFVTWIGAVFVTIVWIGACFGAAPDRPGFAFGVALGLWGCVWCANFAEAAAEGRGRAQAASLRRTREDVRAKRVAAASFDSAPEIVSGAALVPGDLVLIEAGDLVPGDGEAVLGAAAIDESAVTGESAPVVRESGGLRSGVVGGTRVISDRLVVRITARRGETFLDRMIQLVEGAKRGKTPNEIALGILLSALTLVFLIACAATAPFSQYAAELSGHGSRIPLVVLAALLVCLIPTTIGGLLSAVGIAGMDRLLRANVVATSGRAVEAAGDVDLLLLDKTGTITFGNRRATELVPAPGVALRDLAAASRLASLADDTPEGRSLLLLAESLGGSKAADGSAGTEAPGTPVPFAAETRMSGVDLPGRQIRKGATDAIEAWLRARGGVLPEALRRVAEDVARDGATPLVVAEGGRALGVVRLKDVLKPGIRDRFAELRAAGIRTVMVTGDNPLTAAAIAAEAGVDDFLAQATPEAKLKLIRSEQARGRIAAMTGDGTNDAPALAQADVAVAMNSGTQAAKEAANMVDLDSDPTKLLEIVAIGKQLLMTRGALTTFSVANDVAKYFAIVPAAFAAVFPGLKRLDVMHLATAESAVLSAVVFNALVIAALVPLALRGVRRRPGGAAEALRSNLLVYGVGGLIAPFLGIKAVDMVLVALGAA